MSPTTRSSKSHQGQGTPTSRRLSGIFDAEHRSAKVVAATKATSAKVAHQSAKKAETKARSAKTATKASSAKRLNGRRTIRRSTVTLRDIKKLQNSTHSLVPKAGFLKLVEDTLTERRWGLFRKQPNAKLALQHVYEDRAVGFLSDISECAKHTKRETVMQRDKDLVHAIQKKLMPPHFTS